MALPAVRLDYRLTLSNVDRGVDVSESLVAARHPSETAEHMVLRVLAYCLLHEERLELGPGLSDGESADLWTRDLTGQLTTWVECGAADGDKILKVMLHESGVAVHAVFADPRRRDEFLAQVAAWPEGKTRRTRATLTVWSVDRELVTQLAARDARRQVWSVTIVGGHAYLEVDGATLDGAIEQHEPLAAA